MYTRFIYKLNYHFKANKINEHHNDYFVYTKYKAGQQPISIS